MFTRMFSREERTARSRTPAPKGAAALGPSAHVDTFARDNLPPAAQWPDLLLDQPEFQYPEHLNAAVELTDRMVEKGFGDRTALIGNGRRRTYKELTDWSNRLAHALVEDFGVKPGHRVLVRSGNNPAMVAAWLAVTKAGAVAVNWTVVRLPLLLPVEQLEGLDAAHGFQQVGLLAGGALDLVLGGQTQRHQMVLRKYDMQGAQGNKMMSRWIVYELSPQA